MSFRKIPDICSQCGAPLSQNGDRFICEYCGLTYSITPPDSEAKHTENQQDKIQPPHKNERPYHFRSQCQSTDTVAIATDQDTVTSTKSAAIRVARERGLILIFLIIICYLTVFVFNKIVQIKSQKDHVPNSYDISQKSGQTVTSDPNQSKKEPTLIQTIYQEKYHSVEFPAASDEGAPLSTAVILDYADANKIIFSLFVQNRSETDIDTSAATQNLDISSLSVSSNLEDEFICTFEEDNQHESIIAKDDIQRKGVVTCMGSLSPNTSSIDINYNIPNWNTWHLQIPIRQDVSDLEPNYYLTLDDSNYQIDIVLYSKKPQLVWVERSAIAIDDNQGNTLSLEGCTPITSQEGNGEYYLKLTRNSTHRDFLYPKELISCRYNRPFPFEIQSMSISLKTIGKTFISKADINKSNGRIYFTN